MFFGFRIGALQEAGNRGVLKLGVGSQPPPATCQLATYILYYIEDLLQGSFERINPSFINILPIPDISTGAAILE